MERIVQFQILSQSAKKKEKYFIWSFFAVNFLTFISLDSVVLDLPSLLDYLLISVVLIVFFFQCRRNIATKRYHRLIDRILIFLFFWQSIILVLGSIQFEVFFIQKSLKGIYFLLPYLIPPILLLLNVRKEMIAYGMSLSLKLLPFALITIIYVFLNLDITFSDDHYFLISVFSAWLILAFISQITITKYQKYYLLVYFLSTLLISALYGRRTWFVIEALGIGSMVYLSWSRLSSFRVKIIFLVLLLMIALFSLLIFSDLMENIYVFQRGIDLESFAQSRDGVLQGFKDDFNNNGGWVTGRGLNGEVERGIGFVEKGSLIEHGYYARILKGGYIYLITFILLIIRSCYILLSRSHDFISKAIIAMLVIYLIGMIGFNVPVFHITHLSIYLFIAFALRYN